MADLEDLGLIASPHTSAGRVPTPRGYRFFVDTLLTIKPLEERDASAVEGPHAARPAAARDLRRRAGAVEPVAVRRRRDDPAARLVFQHIEFLRLSDKRMLLIIVTPDGDVQNRILFPERPTRRRS